ncbi:hypothetical protein I3760_16G085000 [Carya illinoinensis]|nr:hypothetical protein I3760_16G085000 [Carya illinoinensis]
MRGTRRGVGGAGRMTQSRIPPSHGCAWSGPTPLEQTSRWTQMVEQSPSSDDSTQPPDMILGTQFNEINSGTPDTQLENNGTLDTQQLNNGKLVMRRCRGPAGCTEFMKI